MNDIKHFKTTLYRRATNGLAECFIQTMKKDLKMSMSEGTLSQGLVKFLLSYRTLPHATKKRPHVSC